VVSVDWLSEHAWQAWLIVSLLLAGAEAATLDLTLLMMAAGALAGCGVAAIGLGGALQVVVAAVVAVGMLAFVRPNVVKRLHAGPTIRTGPAALVGTNAFVLERVTETSGRVKLNGEVWTARSLDETVAIEPGARVSVAQIDGATAVVFPADW
jgi:membrane protein implicated in regulation of membrane protease activity